MEGFGWWITRGVVVWAAVSVVAVLRARPSRPLLAPTNVSKLPRADLLDIFSRRQVAYEALLKRLDHVMALQVTLVALAILIASRGPTAQTATLFGVPLSLNLMYGLVPICLIYAWARFGYFLGLLVDTRRALWRILDELRDPPAPNSILTLRPVLRDAGLIDVFVQVLYPSECDWEPHFKVLRYLNLGCYLAFIAAGNAALLGTLGIGLLRIQMTWVRVGLIALMAGAGLWITLTLLQFAAAHGTRYVHWRYVNSVVVALTAMGTVSLLMLAR